jgi:hypothetical protein
MSLIGAQFWASFIHTIYTNLLTSPSRMPIEEFGRLFLDIDHH